MCFSLQNPCPGEEPQRCPCPLLSFWNWEYQGVAWSSMWLHNFREEQYKSLDINLVLIPQEGIRKNEYLALFTTRFLETYSLIWSLILVHFSSTKVHFRTTATAVAAATRQEQWNLRMTIIADGDCSHEIKRRLLLGRKVMTNLDSILKSIDITLPTKVHHAWMW